MPTSTSLPVDTPVLLKAKALASLAHAGQRYGSSPYTVHLAQVERVLRRFGIPPETGVAAEDLLAAGWDHDLLEDTDVTRRRLEILVNEQVAAIVWAVTDKLDNTHPRAERHRATYPQLPETPGAVRVKLGDRMANLEAAIVYGNERLKKVYIQEHAYFTDCLYRPGSPEEPLWQHLNGLVEQVQAVEALMQSSRAIILS